MTLEELAKKYPYDDSKDLSIKNYRCTYQDRKYICVYDKMRSGRDAECNSCIHFKERRFHTEDDGK